MLEATASPPVEKIPESQIQVHIPVCPWCGVRATMWAPRLAAGMVVIRYQCWTGHRWTLTSAVGQ